MKFKINFKKISIKGLKRMIRIFSELLAHNAFFCFLDLFVFALAFSVFVFYKYTFPILETREDIQTLKVKKHVFEEVLGQIQENKQRSDQIDEKEYLNIFVPIGIQETEETEEGSEFD